MEELAYQTRYLDEREGRGRGLSFSYISLLERDQRRPSPELIELLAKALGISPHEFSEYRLGLAQRLFDSQAQGLDTALENLDFLAKMLEHWTTTLGESELPPSFNKVLSRASEQITS